MDVHITYETLFDILRKERSLDELQNLESDFWSHVVNYLQERTSFMKKTSLSEQEKTRVQLSNIKRIIREIHNNRQRKITNLAINTARTESESFVDKNHMLSDEKTLFNNLVKNLDLHRKEVLLQVLNNDMPLGMTASNDVSDATVDSNSDELEKSDSVSDKSNNSYSESDADESVVASSDADSRETAVGSDSSSNSDSNSDSDNEEDAFSEEKPEDLEEILVKFISSVPKFLGKNKKVFGPFEKGVIVSLPAKIVEILVKKSKVKKVMID